MTILPPTDESNPELYSNLTEVDVNFEKFYLIGTPKKVHPDFTVKLTKLTYLPKVAEPRRDWVASVAVPSFIAHGADHNVRKFATVGTGSGLDAIAALDIFDLQKLAITDLHPAVVQAAAGNVRAATAGIPFLADTVESMIAGPGDLLNPLSAEKGEFDLIYENLPNIPLDTSFRALYSGQTSSTYVPAREEKIPDIAHNNLLALHWLAIAQAKDLLSPTGSIISSMGGRVPIQSMLSMAKSVGFQAEVLIYTWKIQSEPEEVIGGYKKNQEDGLGPFYFYPASVLEETFATLTPALTHAQALTVEAALEPHRLDAVSAYEAHQEGIIIAHTVAVIRSTPVSDVIDLL